jgi:hypothetical protein
MALVSSRTETLLKAAETAGADAVISLPTNTKSPQAGMAFTKEALKEGWNPYSGLCKLNIRRKLNAA